MTSQSNFKSKDAATFNRVSPKLKMSRILFWILLWINLFGQVFPVKPIFDLANNMRLVCTIINLQSAVLNFRNTIFGMAAMPILCIGILLNQFNLPRVDLVFILKSAKVHNYYDSFLIPYFQFLFKLLLWKAQLCPWKINYNFHI